jgi:hypothetical protein
LAQEVPSRDEKYSEKQKKGKTHSKPIQTTRKPKKGAKKKNLVQMIVLYYNMHQMLLTKIISIS